MEEGTSIKDSPSSANPTEASYTESNSTEPGTTPSELLHGIREALASDALACEFKMAVFSAATMSYRKDFCVRPFPTFVKDAGGEANKLERLVINASYIHRNV